MNRFPLTMPDILVVAGYLVLVLWVGLHFRRRMKAPSDYFAGGHQVPWWLAGVSHYMSSFSAFTFIAYAQLGYTYGWVAVTLFWATVPACILGGLLFAGRWRRARVITPVEFLERRFNILLRQLFAWAGLPMKIFEDALKIFATSIFLAVGAGISVNWSILACGAVTVAYTLMGGMWALIVTDYVQFLMKLLAILLLLPLAVWHAGGWHAAFSGLPAHFFHLTNGPYTFLYLAGFFVLIGISYNGSWALAQKYYSVSDTREAAKAAYLSAALNFLGAPVMILPAIFARHLLPDLIAQHRTVDVYVMLVLKLLPAGMIGIIVAALLSATMATVGSDFNAMASVLTEDVYHRLLRPEATPATLVRMGRGLTLLLGAMVVGCSFWIANTGQQSLIELMVTVAGVFMAPSFLPLLIALVSRKLNACGALTGYIAGIASGGILLGLRFGLAHHHAAAWMRNYDGVSILVNTAVTALGMVAGSLLWPSGAAERQKIQHFFQQFDLPVIAPNTSAATHRGPIANTTIAVGGLLGAAGLLSTATSARIMDLAVALCLIGLGASFHLRRGRRKDTAASAHHG